MAVKVDCQPDEALDVALDEAVIAALQLDAAMWS